MWIVGILIFVLLLILLFEYRIRKPDQVVLFESKGIVQKRKSRFYPRHFSLAMSVTTHSMILNIEAEATGKIPINVKLAVTASVSGENISQLIRVGGWNDKVVATASKELDLMLQGFVREFSEKKEVEELTAESLNQYLNKNVKRAEEAFGLETLSLIVQSVTPTDEEIAEAIRQQESARIMEQTENANQKARIAAAETKLKADEQILKYEHELELKKFELKEVEQKKENILAEKRLEEELKRSKMKLQLDNEELKMLKENPELLMLSPQIARLAEASQSLRNAKTVVSLSPGDSDQSSQLVGMIQAFIANLIDKQDSKSSVSKK